MLDAGTFTSTTAEPQEIALTETARFAVSVNQKHREVQRLGRTAKEIAAVIGEMLIEVKQKLPHGEFIPWIEAECAFSIRHAQRYIKVHQVKNDTRVAFDRCNSIREVLSLGKPKKEPKTEKRAATLDDLRKVERLRALLDDPATPEAQRESIERKIKRIEDEVGNVEPPKDTAQVRQVARRTACEIMDHLSPVMKPRVRSAVISALMIAYGDDQEKLNALLNELKGNGRRP